jgi:hypothetical protein
MPDASSPHEHREWLGELSGVASSLSLFRRRRSLLDASLRWHDTTCLGGERSQ